MRESAKLPAVKLVFLGDSITDFWLLGDDPWVPGQLHGLKIWNESFAGANPQLMALNLGISGDRLEHVLFRLVPRSAGGLGHLDAPDLKPDFIVLMIGINNTWAPEQPIIASIVAGVRAVLLAAHERKPGSRIVLQSLLPTNDAAKNRDVVVPINQALAMLAAEPALSSYTNWLDLYPGFVDSNGRQIGGLFMKDGLHPAEPGYRVWRDRLLPALERRGRNALMAHHATHRSAVAAARYRSTVAATTSAGKGGAGAFLPHGAPFTCTCSSQSRRYCLS